MHRIIVVNVLILLVFAGISYWTEEGKKLETAMEQSAEKACAVMTSSETGKGDSKEAAFRISKMALAEAYDYDKATYGTKIHTSWIDLLAFTASHTGGDFQDDQEVLRWMEIWKEEQARGRTAESLTKALKDFSIYQEIYEAVLGGLVGEYEAEEEAEEGKVRWFPYYGLKAFHPIAKGFPYTDSDDLEIDHSSDDPSSHLGHDLIGKMGAPVIAVESGYVETLGWNSYGGWRIGIRSFDQKRYYEYAHLKHGSPYQKNLKEGTAVLAGDVIGYMGDTGYGSGEDGVCKGCPHLSVGIQVTLETGEGIKEMWISCRPLLQFLRQQRSETKWNEETKEWDRVHMLKDSAAEVYEKRMDFSAYP